MLEPALLSDSSLINVLSDFDNKRAGNGESLLVDLA